MYAKADMDGPQIRNGFRLMRTPVWYFSIKIVIAML